MRKRDFMSYEHDIYTDNTLPNTMSVITLILSSKDSKKLSYDIKINIDIGKDNENKKYLITR